MFSKYWSIQILTSDHRSVPLCCRAAELTEYSPCVGRRQQQQPHSEYRAGCWSDLHLAITFGRVRRCLRIKAPKHEKRRIEKALTSLALRESVISGIDHDSGGISNSNRFSAS